MAFSISFNNSLFNIYPPYPTNLYEPCDTKLFNLVMYFIPLVHISTQDDLRAK
nr:MAG TPA: hypothetical protein [Caudoviricetes sp.]